MSYTPTNQFYFEVAKGNIAGHSLVHKFGTNHAVPNAVFEIVCSLSVPYAGFLAAPSTVRIQAGGNADDSAAGPGARSITVQGLDNSLARISEDIVTNGGAASLVTSALFWRIDRAFVKDAGTYATPVNTGDIVVEDSGGGADLIQIDAGEGQTLHAHYAVADNIDAYWIGYELSADVTQAADFQFFRRANLNDASAPVSPARLIRHWDGIISPIVREFQTPVFMVSGPADIWFEAAGGGGATKVSAAFALLLVAT